MKIRILGAGWYGCHLAAAFRKQHDVEVWESAGSIFAGASGNIPARLHTGAHYPRSRKTREACLSHNAEFMARYGLLTNAVPINIYAIAADRSMVDFAQYVSTLRDEIEFLTVYDPEEFGLRHVEGAIQVGERHIVTRLAKAHFANKIGDLVRFFAVADCVDDPDYDVTIDCTFCANDAAGVDRYEPCLVAMLKGPTDTAVTIMDGPFPSLYPWDEDLQLCSLSSALWTPFSKTCKTWADARAVIDGFYADDEGEADLLNQRAGMIRSMAEFYPAIMTDYEIKESRLSIRAMPLSGADTRLSDVVRVGANALRVRAGKIDAVLSAERTIRELIE